MSDNFLTPDELGARLRDLRAERGLAQKDLASLADMDPAALSRVETGKRSLGIGELMTIADRLGVGTDDLLLREPEPTPLFRNAGGAEAAAKSINQMQGIMDDFLSFNSVVGD